MISEHQVRKYLLLDETGHIIDDIDRLYDFDIPANGWTEQDPDLWWNAVRDIIPEIIQKHNIEGKDIKDRGNRSNT